MLPFTPDAINQCLAELRARREQIDITIAKLESAKKLQQRPSVSARKPACRRALIVKTTKLL